MSRTSFGVVCDYMAEDIRSALISAEKKAGNNISEIRLYNGRGIAIVSSEGIKYLCRNGDITSVFNSKCIAVNSAHMREILTRISKYSVYSHERELAVGCFVLENGVRAGLSGTYSEGDKGMIRDISSINFRIARQVTGCSDELFSSVYGRSALICGAVNSGKTTLLRDICRSFGNISKCTLIDEKNEIAAVVKGCPTNDVGYLTDIITDKNRHDSIICAIRTLSPDYIFCDEIADSSDAAAIRDGVGCGVKFIATLHAENMDDLISRKFSRELLEAGYFEKAVFLSRQGWKIKEIRSLINVC
ncbi:MAG: hypothetical protein IIZ53_01395 [Ruminococcus sp.]|nr:hypothetical protein [Ruminococcus sp.]